MHALSRARANSMFNLIVVEDSALVRESLREMLADIEGLRIVGEYDNADEAIVAIDQAPPDALVLDIQLRVSNGMQVLRHVKLAHPTMRVIVFSSHSDDLARRRFLAAGAEAFLSKTDETEQLYQTLATLVGNA